MLFFEEENKTIEKPSIQQNVTKEILITECSTTIRQIVISTEEANQMSRYPVREKTKKMNGKLPIDYGILYNA